MKARYGVVIAINLALIVFALIYAGRPVKAQVGLVDPRTTEYVCLVARTVPFGNFSKQGVLETTTEILVLPCEAASVRQDSLTDVDYGLLEKLQLERILLGALKTKPASDPEVRDARSDFLKFAKDICGRHPKMALLPQDWKTEQKNLGDSAEAGGIPLKLCSAL